MTKSTAIVFLHGSGSSGSEMRCFLESAPLESFGHRTFRQVVDSLQMDIVTPTAEYQPYSPLGGERANVWFDRSPDFEKVGMEDVEDVAGVEKSLQRILADITAIEEHYDHFFIGGFSMGGGLGLHALRKLNFSKKIRGIFSFGSYVVNESSLNKATLPCISSSLPVLMMHGDNDCLINPAWGRTTATNLLLRGIDVQFRTYEGVTHEVSDNQLVDFINWMQDIILHHATAPADCKNAGTGALPSPKREDQKGLSGYDQHNITYGSKSAMPADDQLLREVNNLDVKCGHEKLQLSMVAAAKEASDATRERQNPPLGGKETSTGQPSTSGTEGHGVVIPFTIEKLGDHSGSRGTIPRACIHFEVPDQYVPLMIGRPVLACGSMFEMEKDTPNGVKTLIHSTDPDRTAYEIARRLQVRLSSGGASLNACPMS